MWQEHQQGSTTCSATAVNNNDKTVGSARLQRKSAQTPQNPLDVRRHRPMQEESVTARELFFRRRPRLI